MSGTLDEEEWTESELSFLRSCGWSSDKRSLFEADTNIFEDYVSCKETLKIKRNPLNDLNECTSKRSKKSENRKKEMKIDPIMENNNFAGFSQSSKSESDTFSKSDNESDCDETRVHSNSNETKSSLDDISNLSDNAISKDESENNPKTPEKKKRKRKKKKKKKCSSNSDDEALE